MERVKEKDPQEELGLDRNNNNLDRAKMGSGWCGID
jgi:hypothetical protein